MLEPELVRGSPTRTGGDRVLAGRLQHCATAQLVGVPDARRICRGQRLWKRRWLRHLGKRCAFPTFPQPRRRRPYFNRCSGTKTPGSFVMTGPKTGGRSIPSLLKAAFFVEQWFVEQVKLLEGRGVSSHVRV